MSVFISASDFLSKSPAVPDSQEDQAVVIGASAGGVEALLTLLSGLPKDFAAPIFIVIHLPATGPNSIVSLLGKKCALPVKEAEDKETIVPGTVYIAPPDYHLFVETDKYLSLSMEEPEHYSRPSIDLLFESAAYAYRSQLLGIVLTGASMDGAAGLKTVKALGGKAWVQDPKEAIASIMPAAAIAATQTKCVFPLAKIASKLARLSLAEPEKEH